MSLGTRGLGMSSRPLKIENIAGMDNTGGSKPPEVPDVILNMDAVSNSLQVRAGRKLHVALTSPNSLYAVGSVLLCSADGVVWPRSVWEIDEAGNKRELWKVDGDDKLYYVTVGDKTYFSSRRSSGAYSFASRSISSWGVALPTAAPSLAAVSGRLPPGIYSVLFTRINAGGEISGAGPATEIELNAPGGISIGNVAGDYWVWATEADGDKYLFCGSSSFLDGAFGGDALQTLDVKPPQGLTNLIYFAGRIWGVEDKELKYSEAYAYSWFRKYNNFSFEEDILVLAADEGGIYVGTKTATWYQSGRDVRNMRLDKIGNGVIKGTLTHAPIGEANKRVPVWAGKEGMFAGINGQAVKLTGDNLNFVISETGASFFRLVKGEPQIGVTSPEGNFSVSDQVSAKIFRGGRLIEGNYHKDVCEGTIFSDLVTSTVA